ncbi:MAG: manganese/zinc/iron transport system permease protein [Sphingobacteriales bacterium]|jgi:manganese/zinc/iron transport system permease protein
MDSSFWIVLTGILVSWIGSLLGSFLVLRKMAMISDAISHAVLPGLFIGFMIAGSRDSLPLIIGAASFGLFASIAIQYLNQTIRLQTDASIGLVYTLLFSIGIVLVSAYAGNNDFDTDCVLFGEIAFIPLDTTTLFGMEIPKGTLQLFFGLIVVAAFVLIGYRGLAVTSFDPNFAGAIGISLAFWQYSLMGMVSLGTVLSFEAVGVILVVAFLTIPAATAYILTERLKYMLSLSLVFGVTASVLGYFGAMLFDTSISATMAVAAGVQFAVVMMLKVVLRGRKRKVVLIQGKKS